ncbi:hypothetical protein ERN12_14370 [Rhodobacteraceae bacterium]|nr:hypothetical protein ERN12_14370 [Paracoccaceae bacterium]
MRLNPRKIVTAATATALAAALPVTVAMSKGDAQGSELSGTSTSNAQVFSAAARPMEDMDGPIYGDGDLTAFDAIEEIGEDQSAYVPYCDNRATLTATLNHDFAEVQRVNQPIDQNRSVELWASDVMGTWTAVYNRADGVACVVSSGTGWEHQDSPLALLETEEILPARS